MTAYYRNRQTGKVQAHPVSGLGESFNSDEIGVDGKPVKAYVPLGASREETARAVKLAKGDTPKTPEATTGTGSTKKQEGDQ